MAENGQLDDDISDDDFQTLGAAEGEGETGEETVDLNADEQGTGDDDGLEVVVQGEEEPGDGEDDDAISAGGEDDDQGADQQGAAEGEGEGEDEAALDADLRKQGYGKSVRDRIMRERRLARRERAEAQESVRAEKAARLKVERDNLETKQMLNEVLKVNLDNSIKATRDALIKAKEEGETTKEVDLQAELTKLMGQQAEVETSGKAIKARLDNFDTEAKQQLEQSGQQEPTPAVKDWLTRNPWFSNPNFKAEATFLRVLDNQLAAQNRFRVGSPEYVKALDELVHKEMPDLRVKIRRLAATRQQNQGKPRSAGAPPSRGAQGARNPAPTSGNPRRVVLTRADLATMRNFGLNPEDPKARKQYALSKVGRL